MPVCLSFCWSPNNSIFLLPCAFAVVMSTFIMISARVSLCYISDQSFPLSQSQKRRATEPRWSFSSLICLFAEFLLVRFLRCFISPASASMDKRTKDNMTQGKNSFICRTFSDGNDRNTCGASVAKNESGLRMAQDQQGRWDVRQGRDVQRTV